MKDDDERLQQVCEMSDTSCETCARYEGSEPMPDGHSHMVWCNAGSYAHQRWVVMSKGCSCWKQEENKDEKPVIHVPGSELPS